MISNLSISNFKAFEKASIDLKPMTVLLGPNNAGKSSILSVFRLLTQTIESFDSSVPLLLNGIMGDFGTYKDIVFKNSTKRHIKIELIITPKNIPSSHPDEKEIITSLKYSYKRNRRELVLNNISLKTNEQHIIETAYSKESERHIVQKISDRVVPTSLRSNISNSLNIQNFMPLYLMYFMGRDEASISVARKEFQIKDPNKFFQHMMRQSRTVLNTIQRIEYIGAMRLSPSRTYLFTGEKRNRVGSNGDYATHILAMDSARGGSKSQNIKDNVVAWLRKAGIASDLGIEIISDRHFEIRIQHPITREYENYADVGYGNSQIIPILVGGYNLKANSTYLVEQPEIHLHPRAQSELGDFFLDLYNRNIQTIVETHSEHMILRLQQHIAKGLIPSEDIIFHYIYPQNNEKCIIPLRVDENGYFIDEWPEGFFSEKLEEAKQLSKIRLQKELE